jgi:hypothetical protein
MTSLLSLILFAEGNVGDALMNLDEQKRTDPDGISPLILRKIFLDVKAPMTFTFNLSLAFGIFSAFGKRLTLCCPV